MLPAERPELQSPRDLALEVTRLLAARPSDRDRARSALGSLLERGGEGEAALLEVLDQDRLTALIGSRALAVAPDLLSDRFAAAVEEITTVNRRRALALEALAQRVLSLLDSHGIKALPLKGPFLARRVHGDPAMRFVNDFDLLVSLEDLQDAASLIGRLDYAIDDPVWVRGLPELHHELRTPDGRLPRIELHWRIHWYEEAFARDLLGRSVSGDDGLPAPEPDDELAALLLFYARDGFFGLRLAADVAAWWSTFGETAGAAPLLGRHYEDYPRLRRALLAATMAAEAVVQVPAGSILPTTARRDFRVTTAVRLASWSREGEYDQLASNVNLLDGLLMPARELGPFLRRHLLLSRAQIANVYDLDPASWRAAGWQLAHGPKVVMRFVLGLVTALWPRRGRRRRLSVAFPSGPQ